LNDSEPRRCQVAARRIAGSPKPQNRRAPFSLPQGSRGAQTEPPSWQAEKSARLLFALARPLAPSRDPPCRPTQPDPATARSVRTSLRSAGKTLLREAAAPVHPALTQELCLPRPEAALKLARGQVPLQRGRRPGPLKDRMKTKYLIPAAAMLAAGAVFSQAAMAAPPQKDSSSFKGDSASVYLSHYEPGVSPSPGDSCGTITDVNIWAMSNVAKNGPFFCARARNRGGGAARLSRGNPTRGRGCGGATRLSRVTPTRGRDERGEGVSPAWNSTQRFGFSPILGRYL